MCLVSTHTSPRQDSGFGPGNSGGMQSCRKRSRRACWQEEAVETKETSEIGNCEIGEDWQKRIWPLAGRDGQKVKRWEGR